MVYLELCCVLAFRCYINCQLAAGQFNADCRVVVEASFTSHSSREYHHRGKSCAQVRLQLGIKNPLIGCHCPKWDNWCSITCGFPGPEPVVVWILVQLLQRHQSSRPCSILVRSPGMICLPHVKLRVLSFYCQTYTGSECMYQCLKAIWPSIARIPNHLPANGAITSVGESDCFTIWIKLKTANRNDELLHLLARTISNHAIVSAETSPLFYCKVHHRAPRVA